ncbi:hypothetical protein PVK06_022526 [Gossypium arboreum]|uniref:Uncharacterized protein n=1 Tax=Gossypium arboreum TaxID=29729 RepID=A0ABR0P8R6_GOSAR|nr:hypothetical protein PVK06_022526 [Gossypium arboreum]
MDDVLLSFDIAGVDATGGVGAQGLDLSDTVRRMEEYIPQVIVEAAVRCFKFGSEPAPCHGCFTLCPEIV